MTQCSSYTLGLTWKPVERQKVSHWPGSMKALLRRLPGDISHTPHNRLKHTTSKDLLTQDGKVAINDCPPVPTFPYTCVMAGELERAVYIPLRVITCHLHTSSGHKQINTSSSSRDIFRTLTTTIPIIAEIQFN